MEGRKQVKILDEQSSMSSFRRLFHGGEAVSRTIETPGKRTLKSAIKPPSAQRILRPSSSGMSMNYHEPKDSGIPETTLTMALQREGIGLR
jgi:hypothetical protein